MNDQIPPPLANEAYLYLLLCEGGLDVDGELPDWADRWILQLTQIPDPLLYLSNRRDKSPLDVWSALRELGAQHQPEVVRISFLKKLLTILNENIDSPYQIAHALANADLMVEHSDNWTTFALDFSALDHAPITEEEITDNMRTWLSKATQ